MKFYKLFFNDFTDVNGNKIEVGKTYSNDLLGGDDICVYFDLDELCKSFEDEYHDSNSYLMDFSIYEVDLDRLVYDNSVFVRREVSKHGRKKDLEILKNDVDASLKTEVLMMLKNKSKEKQKELINENKR